MSRQPDKAVPLLAGEAFCEKPPLTYWVAAAAIDAFGTAAWAARIPNLLYALITALGVGLLARRSAGPIAGLIAAAAISTFLLSYQVEIWLATDAPLLATVAVALLGAYIGFYAERSRERLCGYGLMHAALALGFMSKSAAAWMVPALAILTLVIWERRWRELLRWELYAGLLLQAAVILTWVWFVYAAPDGPAHLKVFFWNNLVGRFAHIDAPQELQYATGHRNSPGKYLAELPMYVWPWTLLLVAAAHRAWRGKVRASEIAAKLGLARRAPIDEYRPVRFALASSLPALAVLSIAATARNIYLAPALPGLALLLGWWGREAAMNADRWDVRAVRGTAVLMLIAAIVFGVGVAIVGLDAWSRMSARAGFVSISALGLATAAFLAVRAAGAVRRGGMLQGQLALLLAYCALLAGPASQLYRQVDEWQDLARIGHAIAADADGRPLILFAPDETTRALIDMYTRPSVALILGPVDPQSIARLKEAVAGAPRSLVIVQLAGRILTPKLRSIATRLGLERRVPDSDAAQLAWLSEPHLRVAHLYALPNGRRYAVLESAD